MQTLFRSLLVGLLALIAIQLPARAAVTNIIRVLSSPFAFSPTNITIETGDSIRWTNVSANPHDVTPGVKVGNTTNNPVTPAWAATALSANIGTFQVAFSNVGVFPYLCGTHVFAVPIPRPEQTGTVTVVQANFPPQVALLSPADLSTFTAPANVTLSATASDSDGTVASVHFFTGSTFLGSVTTQPYDLPVTLAAGWHQITVRAIDNLGRSNTSAVVHLFANSNRTVAVSGFTFSPNTSTVVVGDTITFTGLANFHTVTGSGTNEPFCGTVSAPVSCAVTFNAAGNFPFHCIPHRSFGMTGLVQVLGPNFLPGVTLTSPANGSVFAAPGTITLTADARDVLGFIRNVRFIRPPSTTVALVSVPPYVSTVSNLAAGSYTYAAIVTDTTGQAVTSSNIVVNVVAPVDIQLRLPTATANGFQFEYTANPGLTYIIEGSVADGSPGSFVALATNMATSAQMTFLDTSSGARADRVYRVSRRP